MSAHAKTPGYATRKGNHNYGNSHQVADHIERWRSLQAMFARGQVLARMLQRRIDLTDMQAFPSPTFYRLPIDARYDNYDHTAIRWLCRQSADTRRMLKRN